MAGGFGKRLGNRTKNIPKPLIKIKNKPILELIISKLENFNYKGKYLTKIGGKVKKISSVKGQFAGLFKISPRGWEIISKFNKTHKIDINNLDITSFFSKFLEKNKKIIKVTNYNQSWFEIDTLNDFRKYNIYKKGINL